MNVEALQQAQFLDVGIEQVTGAGDDCIVAFSDPFVDAVVNAIDDVDIVALTTDHHIRIGTTVEVIVTHTTDQGIPAGTAVKAVVVSLSRIEGLLGLVAAGEADEDVVAVTPIERVIADLAEETVVAFIAREPVIPGAPLQFITPRAAEKRIVAQATMQYVSAGTAPQSITAGLPEEVVVSILPL